MREKEKNIHRKKKRWKRIEMKIEKLNTGKSTTNTYCIILILFYVS